MTKIIIIIGSLLVSGTYLSLGYLLRTEVQDITNRIENAIALNNWDDTCAIIDNEGNLSVCGEEIDLRIGRINNEIEVTYQGGFPEEPNVMIVTSHINLERYCILLDGIIRWGNYTAEGCANIYE